MDTTTPVQMINNAVCVSVCTDALRKDMNPSLLPIALGK